MSFVANKSNVLRGAPFLKRSFQKGFCDFSPTRARTMNAGRIVLTGREDRKRQERTLLQLVHLDHKVHVIQIIGQRDA